MMGFLWNSLRVGERVRVHDGPALVDAEVAFIAVLRGAGVVEDPCLRCAVPTSSRAS